MKKLLVLLVVLLLQATIGSAVTISGNFFQDDDVQWFLYRVATDADVTVSTTSYATGGFQTVLSLFDAGGAFLFDNSGYGTASDATLTWHSLAGVQYQVALTEYDNFARQPTIEDGFTEQGNGNFTAGPPFNNPGAGTAFLLPGGEQRSSAWSVSFDSEETSLTASAVPEPATLVLTSLALLACSRFLRKRAGRNPNS